MAERDTEAHLQQLLDAGADGKPEAYEEVLQRASERFYQLTRRMLRAYPHLRRWEQTDDVLQQALIRLHRSITEIRPADVRTLFGLATLQIRRSLVDLARHYFGPMGAAAHHSSNASVQIRDHVDRIAPPESLHEWTRFHEMTRPITTRTT